MAKAITVVKARDTATAEFAVNEGKTGATALQKLRQIVKAASGAPYSLLWTREEIENSPYAGNL